MEISRTLASDVVDLTISGRLDGYWADHLERALGDTIREGHHHLRLDLAQVSFLSSAGIAVLVKVYKQLHAIGGSLAVVRPSKTVETVLQITRLAPLLSRGPGADTAPAARAADAGPSSRTERDGTVFECFDLETAATLSCGAYGDDEPLSQPGVRDGRAASLGSRTPLMALGVGAFGGSADESRARFGELISVAGATAYQPADGTNVPDYLLSSGALSPDIHLLYGLSCEGRFSRLVRFEPLETGGTTGLGRLLAACLHIAGAQAVGVVIVAEAAGLVGAALRRSPAAADADGEFFDHPGIRSRLSFTSDRAHPRSLTLAAGIVATEDAARGIPQLRPIGVDRLQGHVHAAAFPFRPVRKGRVDLKETVSGLFDAGHLLGVLHLLNDDRGTLGAGESEFNRGACWFGPIGGPAVRAAAEGA